LTDIITTLSTLDDLLEQLRTDLKNLNATPETANSSSEAPAITRRREDYTKLTESDLPRARRLVTARERSITAVKSQISKVKQKQDATSATESSNKP
jgi:hypothetical protein